MVSFVIPNTEFLIAASIWANSLPGLNISDKGLITGSTHVFKLRLVSKIWRLVSVTNLSTSRQVSFWTWKIIWLISLCH